MKTTRMKRSCIAVLASILALSACDDHTDCCGPMDIAANTWGHDTSRFTAVRSAWYKGNGYTSLTFFSKDSTAPGASLSFNFLERPLTSGTYKITGSPLANNEVGIIADDGNTAGFGSLPQTGQLEASLDGNGKLTLYSVGAYMKRLLFTGGDTAIVFFKLTEH